MSQRDAGPTLGVAIPAAGLGRRAGGRKQYRMVGDEPILRRTLRPFLAHPGVRSVAVALPSDDVADPPGWLEGLDPRVRLVEGGESRTASVGAALDALPEGLDLLAVHDAARPLLGADVLQRCLAELVAAPAEVVGVVAGWPAVDTLKRSDERGDVVETPDRGEFWHAHTPQLFRAEALREAYRRARADGVEGTDDAALVERTGRRVRMVRGSRWNLKVTLPEDVAMAEAVLQEGPEGTPTWLHRLAAHVRAGGLLIHPTETVYGVGGRGRGPGLEALRRVKDRGPHRPVLLLVRDASQAPGLEWTEAAEALAAEFWPGPLTLVLRDEENRYEDGVRSAEGGVGVRDTPHPLVRAFLEVLGEPLTSTSANRPGEEPPRRADAGERALGGLDAGAPGFRVLDGGPLPPSPPSTVVDCTGATPRLVRSGALSLHRLAEVVPEVAEGGRGHHAPDTAGARVRPDR